MTQAESKNWFKRNWLWAVPTGCLTLVVLCAAGIALLVAVVFGAMKSSDAYKEALVKVQASRAVADALGTPIEPGYVIGGSVKVDGATGTADLSIPLSGPKARGTLTVKATKAAGQWVYSIMALDVEGSKQHLDLLGEVSTSAAPVQAAPDAAAVQAAPGTSPGQPAPEATPAKPAAEGERSLPGAEGARDTPAPATKSGPQGGQ